MSMAGRARGLSLAIVTALSCGYGSSPITDTRLERALASTFANLVHLQVSWMGLPSVSPSEFGVTAKCRKVGVGVQQVRTVGSGEWLCTLDWRGPDRRIIRETYDLFVAPDGCYTATVEGEALARPMLTTSDGRDVKNLLYVFDGCFDTT
jgi:ABC-2 type transport system permease protein